MGKSRLLAVVVVSLLVFCSTKSVDTLSEFGIDQLLGGQESVEIGCLSTSLLLNSDGCSAQSFRSNDLQSGSVIIQAPFSSVNLPYSELQLVQTVSLQDGSVKCQFMGVPAPVSVQFVGCSSGKYVQTVLRLKVKTLVNDDLETWVSAA